MPVSCEVVPVVFELVPVVFELVPVVFELVPVVFELVPVVFDVHTQLLVLPVLSIHHAAHGQNGRAAAESTLVGHPSSVPSHEVHGRSRRTAKEQRPAQVSAMSDSVGYVVHCTVQYGKKG